MMNAVMVMVMVMVENFVFMKRGEFYKYSHYGNAEKLLCLHSMIF